MILVMQLGKISSVEHTNNFINTVFAEKGFI